MAVSGSEAQRCHCGSEGCKCSSRGGKCSSRGGMCGSGGGKKFSSGRGKCDSEVFQLGWQVWRLISVPGGVASVGKSSREVASVAAEVFERGLLLVQQGLRVVQ